MTAVERTVERFPAVTLRELVAGAELLTRVDRKYLLPTADAVAVIRGLDASTRVLDLEGARGCEYASVYFDTPDRLSYRLAAQPRRRRFKLRTRVYAGTRTAFLEMKTRGGRGATVKDRIPYAAQHLDRLTAAGRAYAAESLESIGFDPDLESQLRPALTTRYRRTTLLLADGSRATVDSGLVWIDADGRCLALPGQVIVESKSVGCITPLDRELWRSGHRPQNISKFGTGTAALHPELPGNRWARLLRGPFAAASRTHPHTLKEHP